jgi:hypothetical protein
MIAQRFRSSGVLRALMGGAPAIGAVVTEGHGVVYATLNKKSHPTILRFTHGAASQSVYRFLISSHFGSGVSSNF